MSGDRQYFSIIDGFLLLPIMEIKRENLMGANFSIHDGQIFGSYGSWVQYSELSLYWTIDITEFDEHIHFV